MAPHTYQDPIGFYEWFDDLPYAIQDRNARGGSPGFVGSRTFFHLNFNSTLIFCGY